MQNFDKQILDNIVNVLYSHCDEKLRWLYFLQEGKPKRKVPSNKSIESLKSRTISSFEKEGFDIFSEREKRSFSYEIAEKLQIKNDAKKEIQKISQKIFDILQYEQNDFTKLNSILEDNKTIKN